MNYLLLLFFGLAPSIIWLGFYLRKDSHPESNRMVLKIFFYGMLAAIPTAIIEIGFYEAINKLTILNFSDILVGQLLIKILYIFVGVALVEEFLKYLTVRSEIVKNSELDEPVDVMLYMIIAALGFAALENILFFLPLGEPFVLAEALTFSAFRFVGATFLHALCSGTLGFFLALSFYELKRKKMLFIAGLTIATFLHGLYNFSIMEIEGRLKFVIPAIILISLALVVSLSFKKLKEMTSVCKIK